MIKGANIFLEKYSNQPIDVDRLIVSTFLKIKKRDVLNNNFLQSYLIEDTNQIEYGFLNGFVEIIETERKTLSIEDIIELFEFVISPSDRIVNGAIYTPVEIREYIVAQVLEKYQDCLDQVQIADIACGCGGFLCTAAKAIKEKTGRTYAEIFRTQIFGLDIQDYSITRSKLLLSLLALSEGEDEAEFNFNLHQGDALVFNWKDHYEGFDGFDIVIGNPPYVCVRNLDQEVKENLKHWSVAKVGNPDLYIPFFQIGYENLKKNGILGYITMNTFFKSLNGRELRKYFEDNRVSLRIIDFGTLQVFKSKSTYTCICFLEPRSQNYIEYYKSIAKELPGAPRDYVQVNYINLDASKGWNLNENEIISRIENTGTPFGKLYKTRNGIATLRNKIYIFEPVAEDDEFYYLQNGQVYPIEKGICKDILNSNKLSRSINLEDVKEKILFPYTNAQRPRALPENELREQFPMAYAYLRRKRAELANRDNGEGKYEAWYAFGRTQSLERIPNKLLFPKYSDKEPDCLISQDENLLYYNGPAVVGHSEEEMLFIKKIIESRLFWYYVKTTSKPYSSSYFSFDNTYIKNFGVAAFSQKDIDYLLEEKDKDAVNAFIEDFYNIEL